MDVSNIEIANSDHPTKVGIHSVEGFGKTTFMAAFPDLVVLPTEQKAFPRDLKVRPKAFPVPETWEEVKNAVRSLRKDKHPFKSFGIDTWDWLMPIIEKYVMGRDSERKTEMNQGSRKLVSIEDYGWGRGYVAVEEEAREFLRDLDKLQTERGMHIIIACHSSVATFQNPAGDDFDRWQPKCHKKLARLFTEWVENLMFGHYEIEAVKEDEKQRKAKGLSTGKRLLGTRQSAMYDAKNRVGLPDIIELEDPIDFIPYLWGAGIEQPEQEEWTPLVSTMEPLIETRPEPKAPPTTPEKSGSKPAPAKMTAPAGKGSAPMKGPGVPQGSAATKPAPAAPATETRASGQASKPSGSRSKADEFNAIQSQTEKVMALREAGVKKMGAPFGKKIDDWMKKASGDEEKVNEVIARIEEMIA